MKISCILIIYRDCTFSNIYNKSALIVAKAILLFVIVVLDMETPDLHFIGY